MKRENHFVGLGESGRIILKWIMITGEGADWIFGSTYSQVTYSSKHSHDLSDSIKGVGFFTT
jgi:hypothetical protein